MIVGLYAAATGMIGLEERQAVIANNLANVSTPGYKRQDAILEGFYEVFKSKLNTPQILNRTAGPGGGLRTLQTYSDTKNGPLFHTGNPLNVGLIGPGYFGVDTPEGTRYTRDGSFSVDADGQLATPDGFKVLGGGGPIDVNEGYVQFDNQGNVLINGVVADQLQLVEFDEPRRLERLGYNLYAAPEDAAPTPALNTTVTPESIESSNVQVPYEMAQMMVGLRAYNANQKVINAIDETVGRLINDVGAPA